MENTINSENLILINKILPNNKIKEILKDMQNFLQVNTGKFDRLKFLNNYYSYLLYKFNLPQIELWFDTSLTKKNEDDSTIRFAYAKSDLKIFVNEDILNKPQRFFYDLFILTHEFCHLLIDNENKSLVRNIGSNPYRYKLGHYKENALNLGLSEDINYYIYLLNEVEYSCDNFGYDFVLNLMAKSLEKFKSANIDKCIFVEHFKKMQKLQELRIANYNQLTEIIMPQIKLKAAIKQEEWLYTFKSLINNNLEKYKNQKPDLDFIKKIVDIQEKLFISFSVHENFEVLNDFKNFCDLKSYKMPVLSSFYTNCLNFPNYVVQKEDIQKLLKYVNIKNEAFSLTEIMVDKEDLKKAIIEIAFGSYDKDFDNYILNNNLIKDNFMLCKTYKTFLKVNHKHENDFTK